ncbi:unnamed protein product [Hymenolepis diminuta]|uniref:Peptidase A2 domain-containing protein n=1 Tax=Hymenolepis diminuta TaxID=6216 RepID=A0A564Y759_HYMDI|nr:unnamed protein product [Hymenolepis diminuta]
MRINVRGRRYETLCINETYLGSQVDTGSDITIVSNEAWKTLDSPKLGTVSFKVTIASADVVQLWLRYQPPRVRLNPRVICSQMLVEEMMKRFAAVLEDILRKCTQSTARLFLKSGANFAFRPKRSVLIAAVKMAEEELNAEKEETVVMFESVERDVQRILTESIRNTPASAMDMRKETDTVLRQALKFVPSKWPSFPPKSDLRELCRRRDSVMIADSCLMFLDKVIVPSALRNKVLR